jgi:hypothetical protein
MGMKLSYTLKQDRLRILEDRVKEEKSLYRPEQAMRVYMKLVRLSTLCSSCLYSPGNIPVRGCVNHRAIAQPEGLCQ